MTLQYIARIHSYQVTVLSGPGEEKNAKSQYNTLGHPFQHSKALHSIVHPCQKVITISLIYRWLPFIFFPCPHSHIYFLSVLPVYVLCLHYDFPLPLPAVFCFTSASPLPLVYLSYASLRLY
jgi:hypothetical protein